MQNRNKNRRKTVLEGKGEIQSTFRHVRSHAILFSPPSDFSKNGPRYLGRKDTRKEVMLQIPPPPSIVKHGNELYERRFRNIRASKEAKSSFMAPTTRIRRKER